jgi:predicted dehydrogenase
LRVGRLDADDITKKQPPQVVEFPVTSTERAELEHFARAAAARRPLATADGDEVHNVAVLEAIVASARSGMRAAVAL